MAEKISMAAIPAIHPSCAIHQANDSIPDPITVVMMCPPAVHKLPTQIHGIRNNQT